jgi:nicotinate-nucleotide--dimethylbenzimidazole phosphoribosyltransferase
MTTREELEALLGRLPAPDVEARARVAARAERVLRPRGALARLDEVAAWLAAWQRTERPAVRAPAAVVFVADHGVAAERVSAYPTEVTEIMLRALRAGAATAPALARGAGARLEVVDVGVGLPTANLRRGAAQTAQEFSESIARGRAAVAALDTDLLLLGEMGIANTTAAAATAAALFGGGAEDWTGRGSGIDEVALARKTEIVDEARRRVDGEDALETLRQVGGSEMAAIAGAALEARLRSIPVIMDGYTVTASLAALEVTCAGALDHCIAGHCSIEPGHHRLLEKLGKVPLLDLGLGLGEASGALLALPLIRLAASSVVEVATFEEWEAPRS